MYWLLFLCVAAAVLLIGIWFLQKFYVKASLSSALVRTGFGGQRVILSGGCVSLPILHQTQRVNMAAVSLPVSRTGRQALLSADQLRADLEMEFEFQVTPNEEGVALAAQSLGQGIARGSDGIQEVIKGPLIAAMQNAVAGKTLAQLHSQRTALSEDIQQAVESKAAKLGLSLISVSILRLDQADISQLDERNAFDAQGMRHHAELIASQRRARVRIETETDIAVAESGLAKHQRCLEIAHSEREASISNEQAIAQLEAQARAQTEKTRTVAELEAERARIEAAQKAKAFQVSNDEELRRSEMGAILALEETRIANDAHLAKLRTAEAQTQAAEEAARAQVILAAEDVQAKKDLAIAKREHETARARLEKELELSDLQATKDAQALAIRTKAEAEAKARLAQAELAKSEAEAKARSAMIAAENAMDPALIAMHLEERRLDRMPEIMTQMMKPVEKIDSIKINQIAGLGGSWGEAEGSESAFGSAMDQILGMAVRLPAMKQMGEEIGLDFDANLAGRTADYANRIKPKDQKQD